MLSAAAALRSAIGPPFRTPAWTGGCRVDELSPTPVLPLRYTENTVALRRVVISTTLPPAHVGAIVPSRLRAPKVDAHASQRIPVLSPVPPRDRPAGKKAGLDRYDYTLDLAYRPPAYLAHFKKHFRDFPGISGPGCQQSSGFSVVETSAEACSGN